MIDANTEEILTIGNHVVKGRDDVRRTHIPTAKARGSVIDSRDPVNWFVSHLTVHRIAEGCFDFASQVIACR